MTRGSRTIAPLACSIAVVAALAGCEESRDTERKHKLSIRFEGDMSEDEGNSSKLIVDYTITFAAPEDLPDCGELRVGFSGDGGEALETVSVLDARGRVVSMESFAGDLGTRDWGRRLAELRQRADLADGVTFAYERVQPLAGAGVRLGPGQRGILLPWFDGHLDVTCDGLSREIGIDELLR